jgi:hypothetical protein
LSLAEWRLLGIPFAGGLGSIVAAACVLGGAIALARHQESIGLGQLGLFTAALLCVLVLVLWASRHAPQATPPR